MRIVLGSFLVERFLNFLFDLSPLGVLTDGHFVNIRERSIRPEGGVDLLVGNMDELKLAPNHMTQTCAKRIGSEMVGGDAVGKHLLQSRSAVRDPSEEKMKKAEKVKTDIVIGVRLARDHRFGDPHDIRIDSIGDVPAGRIAIREMAVLMRQYCTKSILIEVVEHGDSEDQNTIRLIGHFLSEASAFVDGEIGSGRYSDLVYWARLYDFRDTPHQMPQLRCFCFRQGTARVVDLGTRDQ
jgi:hypothetical protein